MKNMIKFFILHASFFMSLMLFAAEMPSLVVSTATDVIDPEDGRISLREAFLYAQEDNGTISEDGGYKITFDSAKLGPGVYAFNLASNIVLEAAKFVDKRVIIDGAIDAGDDKTVNAGDLIAEFGGDYAITSDDENADFDISVNYVRFNGVSLELNVNSLRAKFDTCFFGGAGLDLEAADSDSDIQIINSTIVSNATGVAITAPTGARFLAINSSFGDCSSAAIHLNGGVGATILASTVVKSGIGIKNESSAAVTLYNALVADNTTDVSGDYAADYSLIGLSESVTREAVFGTNGAYLAYKTVSGGTALMPTYAILSGADAADGTPSVAAGMGAWFKYYSNPSDNFITEVDMSALSTTRGMSAIWGAKDEGDAETYVIRDETETDFSSNLPSAGAYWVYTEIPSLVVTTVKDVVNGSDGETSLREAVAYARRLAADSTTPLTITFNKNKIEDEAGHIPSGWAQWTIYPGKSFTWKRGEGGRGDECVGGNSDGAFNLAGIDCGLIINGNFDTNLDITIDGNSTRDLFALDENSKLQLKDIRLQHAANTFIGDAGSILYLNRASICDMTNGLDVGTLILEESSIHNISSGPVTISAAKLSAHNSTIGVSGMVQVAEDAQLLNATVKGDVGILGNLNAVNSLIEGKRVVFGTEWTEYCAFSNDLGFAAISIEGDDAHRGYYTFSADKDWAKYGTILQRNGTAFTWTSGDFPGYNWGVRWAEGDKSTWAKMVNLTPDVWHCWPVGTSNETVTILKAGIVSDQIDELRIPHKNYCSMGAWAAYTAVAWKSNTAGGYLGTDGSSWVSRNNYYYYVQDGVDSLAEDNIDDELNEGKETLYLIGTTIADGRLADSSRSTANTVIIKDNPTTLYGTSWTITCLSSSSSTAIQINGQDTALIDFAIAGGMNGVTITNAAVYANRLSVNSNSGDAIKVQENSTLEMLNSTVAKNVGEGILVKSGSTATLIDVTVAGNATGLNGAGTINAANTLVWANTKNYGGEYNLAYPVDESFAEGVAFASNGRQVAVSYNGLAGWSGTKVAKVGDEYIYLERGNAKSGWLPRDQWSWKKLVGGAVTTAPESFISVDQAGSNRFGAEAIGYDEFTIGAYQPDVKLTVRLIDQWTVYNSMAQVMNNSDAIFEIVTSAAGLHGQSNFYYSVADHKLYTTYTAVANQDGRGWSDVLSGEVTDVTGLSLSAAISSASSGQQIHANLNPGYGTTVSGLSVSRGGVTYSGTYSVTYDGNAKFFIYPRQISLCEAITPAKVYDGNTQVVIGEEGLRKAGVINAEVAVECDKVAINYESEDVIPLESDYYAEHGSIQTNDDTRLVVDWNNVTFSGNSLYLGDYTFKREDLYAIIVPKPITITPQNAEKFYDGAVGAPGEFVYSDPLVEGDTYTGAMEITTCGPAAGEYTSTFRIGTYTVNDGNNGNNYALTLVENATYTIKPKLITLKVKVDSRVYNGSNVVSPATAVDHTAQETGVGEQTFAIASVGDNNATYASAHVVGTGTVQQVTIADPSLVVLTPGGGAEASNYAITYSASGAITKRTVQLNTISSTKTRTYDGSTTVSVDTDDQSTYSFAGQDGDTGLVTGEDLKLSGSGVVPSSQEGDFSSDTVTWEMSSLAIANGSKGVANDYNLDGFASGENETKSHVVIERFEINIELSATRVYDGTTNIAPSVVSATVKDGNGKALAFTSAIEDETNKVFTITTGLKDDNDNAQQIKVTVWNAVLSDNANANESWVERMLSDCRIEGVNADLYDYRFTIGGAVLDVTPEGTTAYTFAEPLTNAAKITKRAVTLTADSGEWVYDGDYHTVTNWTESGTGFVEGEGIKTLSMTAASTIRDVQYSGSTVTTIPNTIDKYTLNDNTLASNYTITTKTGTLKVTPFAIKITSTKPGDIIYGSSTEELKYTTSSELHGSDKFEGALTIAGNKSTSGNYISGDHDVTIGSLVINDGNNGKNYTVTYEKSTFNVGQKSINIAFTAKDKVYDGTTAATRKGDFSYSGLLNGDVFVLDDSQMTYVFNAKDVGYEDEDVEPVKTVTAIGYVSAYLTGADVANYEVSFTTNSSNDAAITQVELEVALDKITKVFDNTVTTPILTNVTTVAGVNGESFTFGAVGVYADVYAAESNRYFVVDSLSVDGLNGAKFVNYRLRLKNIYVDDYEPSVGMDIATDATPDLTNCVYETFEISKTGDGYETYDTIYSSGEITPRSITLEVPGASMEFGATPPVPTYSGGKYMIVNALGIESYSITLGYSDDIPLSESGNHYAIGSHSGAIIGLSATITNKNTHVDITHCYNVNFGTGTLTVRKNGDRSLNIGELDPEKPKPISVDPEWLDRYVEAFKDWGTDPDKTSIGIDEVADNGIEYWKNYVLGLDPTDRDDKIWIDAEQVPDAGKIRVEYRNLINRVESGYIANYRLDTELKGASIVQGDTYQRDPIFDIKIDDESKDPTGYYTIQCVFSPTNSAGEFDIDKVVDEGTTTVNTFGVLKVTPEASRHLT